VGPWFLSTFGASTHLEHLDYVILLPSVDICVRRVATRRDHGFTDEPATRKMHEEFASARIAERHVLRDPPEDPAEVVVLIESARAAGRLVLLVVRRGFGSGERTKYRQFVERRHPTSACFRTG
jgi:hypothetical protein